MVLCQITKLSIPAEFFLGQPHTHTFIFSRNTLSLFVQADFCCWLLRQGDADFKAEKKIPEHKDGQTWLCLVDTPSLEMYSVIFRQTEPPHTHTNTFLRLVLGWRFQSMQVFWWNADTHTHQHTHMNPLEYPVTIGCTHQSLQCLLCVWRQTVINWEHPSGTSTDWLHQSQPICCNHWNVCREPACWRFVSRGACTRGCVCVWR